MRIANTLLSFFYWGKKQTNKKKLESNTVQYSVPLNAKSKEEPTFAVVIGVLLLFIIRAKDLFRFLRFLRGGFSLRMLSSSGIGWLPDGTTTIMKDVDGTEL